LSLPQEIHAIACDNGGIRQIVGNDSKHYSDYRAGLIKYDAETGRMLERADLEPNSCDPQGLAMHNGVLASCDAGIHPGWPVNGSLTTGLISGSISFEATNRETFAIPSSLFRKLRPDPAPHPDGSDLRLCRKVESPA
jgi:hypothetical protein